MKLKVQYGQLLFVALGICSDVLLLQHENMQNIVPIRCPCTFEGNNLPTYLYMNDLIEE